MRINKKVVAQLRNKQKDKIDLICDETTNNIIWAIDKNPQDLWSEIWNMVYCAVNCEAKEIYQPKK